MTEANFKKMARDLIALVCGDHRYEDVVTAKLRELYMCGRADRKKEEGDEWISLRSYPDETPGR
jgi:hypothetical protein